MARSADPGEGHQHQPRGTKNKMGKWKNPGEKWRKFIILKKTGKSLEKMEKFWRKWEKSGEGSPAPGDKEQNEKMEKFWRKWKKSG